MSEQSRPLARSELLPRATDTRPPHPPLRTPAPADPVREHLTPTIIGVILFAAVVVVLVARFLYAGSP